jgi:hypothetical protein
MATSNTTTFNLEIDEVIEDAYERCGVQTRSGYDLKSARRSLNILFSEWGNRGIHLWKVTNQTSNLTAGTTTYTAPSAYTNDPDAPFRFLPCMVSGLAFYLSQKKNPQATQSLKLYYEDELQRALTEDGQRSSVHIVPQNYYISGS